MKRKPILIAIALSVICVAPAFSKKEVETWMEIKHSGNGWNRPEPTRFLMDRKVVPSDTNLGQSKLPLPGTPMGAAVRQPGDYLYQKGPSTTHKGVRPNPALPDTPMGSTVGRAGDHVARQRASTTYNNMGLPESRIGSVVGMPGDKMRSDLKGNNTIARLRQPVRSNKKNQSVNAEQQTANYAAVYDTNYGQPKKRNY